MNQSAIYKRGHTLFNKVIILISLMTILSNALIISHTQQLSYRLGTNYAGTSSSESLNKNCQPQEEPVFNPVAVQPVTISCTLPRVFSPSTNSCECLAETIYNSQTNECICPVDRPLWNGRNCVKCPDYTYFDAEERQCYQCPEGFIHAIGYGGKPRCEADY